MPTEKTKNVPPSDYRSVTLVGGKFDRQILWVSKEWFDSCPRWIGVCKQPSNSDFGVLAVLFLPFIVLQDFFDSFSREPVSYCYDHQPAETAMVYKRKCKFLGKNDPILYTPY